jgi:cytochrome c-type biogenesis protein CcmH
VRKLLIICSLLFVSLSAQAVIETRSFADPALEERYKVLINELRCLVCQNNNLADSNAELAKDLREHVYSMLISGASDTEIIDYMVARYGDFVLFRPPFKSTTVALWIGPFILMALGVLGLVIVIRRRNRTQEEALTDVERAQVRRLLDRDE